MSAMAAGRRPSRYLGKNDRRHYGESLSPYPDADRYGRPPQRFFCRNCIIYIDNPVVAEKHSEVTEHDVVDIQLSEHFSEKDFSPPDSWYFLQNCGAASPQAYCASTRASAAEPPFALLC